MWRLLAMQGLEAWPCVPANANKRVFVTHQAWYACSAAIDLGRCALSLPNCWRSVQDSCFKYFSGEGK